MYLHLCDCLSLDMVEVIIKAGADPNAFDNFGRGLLVRAVNHKSLDLVEILLQLIHDLGQGITGVHPSPMVGLKGSDVETWFVIPHGEKIIQSIMGQGLHWGRSAVPGCLQCIFV